MARTRSVFVIDYFFDQERKEQGKAGPRRFAQQLRKEGRLVDEIYAFCVTDAVISICRDIEKQENKNRKIDILRFYGHGGYGVQNVGGNRDFSNEATLLAVRKGKLLHRASLALIRPLLTEYSRIELHGCKAGGGDEGAGLLQELADLLRVEVRASAVKQYSVDKEKAGKFEGVVLRAIPDGGKPIISVYD